MSDNLILAVLARIEAGQTDSNAHLVRFGDRLGEIGGRIGEIEGRIGQLDGLMAQLVARIDRLEANYLSLRVDLMARMDRLQNEATAIRDDITVNMATAQRAHEAADNTRAELRLLGEEVTGLYRKLTRLEARVREITGDP